MELWPSEANAWDTEQGIEQDWDVITTYNMKRLTRAKGIGFRIVEPRMEPAGEQFPNPAWSISQVSIKAQRWLFIRRTISIPWD